MEVNIEWEDDTRENCIVKVKGTIDTMTADELEVYMDKAMKENPKVLSLDFKDVDYMTSAGLRILLSGQKKAKSNGQKMKLCHVNSSIINVFVMTGFIDILDVVTEMEGN